jgi:hypothetical protein
MRWPVNPGSFSSLLTVAFAVEGRLHAAAHMASAFDHADIRGLEPHIAVGQEPASLPGSFTSALEQPLSRPAKDPLSRDTAGNLDSQDRAQEDRLAGARYHDAFPD